MRTGERQFEAVGEPPERQPLFTRDFLGVCLTTFLFFTAFLFFFPTLPFYIVRLGGQESEIGLLIGASSLTSLVVRPLVGRLVDQWGRRPLLSAGLAMLALCSVLYNFATAIPMLFALRLLTGASLATYISSASTMAADVSPPARRGEAMGYFGVANNLAFIIGPALGFYLVDSGRFAGPNGAIRDAVPGFDRVDTGEFNFAVMFLAAAALAGLGFLVSRFLGESRPAGAAPPALGRNLLGGLFHRSAAYPAVINFTMSIGFAALVTFLPLYARDLGMENVGTFFIVYGAAVLVSRVALSRLSDRYGRGVLIVPGLALLAAALVGLSLAGEPWQLYPVAACYGLGFGTAQPALMAFAVDRVPSQVRGMAMSTFTLGNDLGLSIGATFLGVVLDATDYGAVFLVTAGTVASGIAIFLAGQVLRPSRSAPAGTPADR
ncbi:MAG TPA: MFS transporter [Dehalococcoidia bacterium]